MIDKIQSYFEKQAFGVCEWWGKKLGVKAPSVRLSFIYLSFITFGSPLFIYLIMVFILKNKEIIKSFGKKRIWDL